MPEQKPNILHIFCDQLRGDAIHAMGNPVIKTPNIDRLANEGVAFENAFSPSPVCISARCSMIYGQYPHNTDCYENTPMPTDDRQSFMGALTEAGYKTHGIGKCHFSPDGFAMRGFESREIQMEICGQPEKDDYLKFLWDNGFKHVCDPNGIRGEMYYVPQPAQMPAELHPTNFIGDRTVTFINEQKDSDQPWHCLSSYIHPHPPFCPPNPWHKLYRAPLMPLPNVPQDAESLHTWINRHQNRYKYRDQGIDNNLMRNMKAYYYAIVSFIDFQIGKILKALEETDQLDNTLILFTSDHGEHLGDYNCFGKRSFHNSAARVPMLVKQPGRFEGGKRIKTPVSLVDVAPTFLAAADTDIKSHSVDGVDLKEIAEGTSERKTVFGQHMTGPKATYMAVTEDWKYIYSAGDNQEFLFDKTEDPRETRNKAGIPFLRDVKGKIKQTLIDHLTEGKETEGLVNGDWKEFPKVQLPSDPDTGLLIQDHPWADTSISGYTD